MLIGGEERGALRCAPAPVEPPRTAPSLMRFCRDASISSPCLFPTRVPRRRPTSTATHFRLSSSPALASSLLSVAFCLAQLAPNVLPSPFNSRDTPSLHSGPAAACRPLPAAAPSLNLYMSPAPPRHDCCVPPYPFPPSRAPRQPARHCTRAPWLGPPSGASHSPAHPTRPLPSWWSVPRLPSSFALHRLPTLSTPPGRTRTPLPPTRPLPHPRACLHAAAAALRQSPPVTGVFERSAHHTDGRLVLANGQRNKMGARRERGKGPGSGFCSCVILHAAARRRACRTHS